MSRKHTTNARSSGRARSRVGLLAAFVCAGIFAFATNAAAVPISGFVISEVMYDPIGADDGGQWIELYNGTGSTIDLSLYEIQWGRLFLTDSVSLTGSLTAGSTFVIGGPTSDASNGNPVYDQVFNFNPDLGDGTSGFLEDGIALVETASGTMLHTVVYGGNGFAFFPTFFDEQGNPATIIDDSALNPGDSLEFLGTDTWQVQTNATPGTPDPALTPVPEPTPVVLVGIGLIVMASLRSRGFAGKTACTGRITGVSA
jgi:hypothetical protein